jgi:SAM-dependent methyltransferase
MSAPTANRPAPVFNRMQRSAQIEILDGEVETADLADILHDLARFNGIMQGHQPVLRWLDRAVKSLPPNRPLTLLDIGSGYGDLLRAVRGWARKRGRSLRLIGVDLSPQVVDVARSVTPDSDEIEYHAADIFAFTPPAPIDLVVTSLVTHHLSDDLIARFLRWIETNASRGWMIYDLQRSVIPFYFIAFAGIVLRLHPVVTYDGRVSVARSLTRREWGDRLAAAGIPRNSVDLRWFMFRFAIGRLK